MSAEEGSIVSKGRGPLKAKGGVYCKMRGEYRIVSQGIGVFSAKGGEYCQPKEGNIVRQGRGKL